MWDVGNRGIHVDKVAGHSYGSLADLVSIYGAMAEDGNLRQPE